ncbi:heparan-alpha-glucosaminide N-acetyltransferase [Marinicellulosiphila megalodicopiae]|uniref:heparan-alpha-glucosaminide N-acetyltransferase n=1 Tax=Marinicellulosiphila megalodicopiae TaxID=2724896 RepID=UPI003BAE2B4D
MSQYHRSLNLDVARGSAIVFMAVFHFWYYLSRLFDWSFRYDDPKVFLLRLLVMTLFLGCAGIGLALQAKRGYRWPSFLKRTGLLGICALFISVASYMFVPNNWIYFGILQFLFVSTFVGVLFSFIPKISLVMGILIITGHFFVTGQIFSTISEYLISTYNISNLQYYFSFQFLFNFLQPYLNLPKYTFDISYFVPWFGLVLIGIFIGSLPYKLPSLPNIAIFKILAIMGRHALPMYFIHAIALAPIALGIEWMVNGNQSTAMQLINSLF